MIMIQIQPLCVEAGLVGVIRFSVQSAPLNAATSSADSEKRRFPGLVRGTCPNNNSCTTCEAAEPTFPRERQTVAQPGERERDSKLTASPTF